MKENKVDLDKFSKEIIKDVNNLIKSEEKQISELIKDRELVEELVFSIDNQSTKAVDDCLSIISLEANSKWKIGIHISDVDCRIQ